MKSIVLLMVVLGSLSARAAQDDTLICNGKARALISNLEENLVMTQNAKAIYRLGSSDVLIIIDARSYNTDKGKASFYYQLDFPSLQMSCDIRSDDKSGKPLQQICAYELLNEFGLDTNKVFIFTTLKGKIPETELNGRVDSVKFMRSFIAKRNIDAEINITDENLYQDNVMFGSYVLDSLPGQNGLLRHFQLYNAKGVLICTATEVKGNTHEWRLLTYKDKRFHSQTFASENDLLELIRFLIRNEYL